MAQCFNQSLRLLQVFGIKPFGEPIIDLREQFMRVLALALTLLQARQAGRGA